LNRANWAHFDLEVPAGIRDGSGDIVVVEVPAGIRDGVSDIVVGEDNVVGQDNAAGQSEVVASRQSQYVQTKAAANSDTKGGDIGGHTGVADDVGDSKTVHKKPKKTPKKELHAVGFNQVFYIL
jgi:hypothetical protein